MKISVISDSDVGELRINKNIAGTDDIVRSVSVDAELHVAILTPVSAEWSSENPVTTAESEFSICGSGLSITDKSKHNISVNISVVLMCAVAIVLWDDTWSVLKDTGWSVHGHSDWLSLDQWHQFAWSEKQELSDD